MRAVQQWIEEARNKQDPLQFDANDVVPDNLAVDAFRDTIEDTNQSALHEYIKACTGIIGSCTDNEAYKKRARVGLRLGLGIAVHCSKFQRRDCLHVKRILEGKQSLIASEYRYFISGGVCSHAASFPFYCSRSDIPPSAYRKSVDPKWFAKTNKPRAPETPENVFSNDIIVRILCYCDAQTLCRAITLSREWNLAEKKASSTIWMHLFMARWPSATMANSTNFKLRYMQRCLNARSRKVGLGSGALGPPIFCPHCDRVFSKEHHLNKHQCAPEKPKKRLKKIVNN